MRKSTLSRRTLISLNFKYLPYISLLALLLVLSGCLNDTQIPENTPLSGGGGEANLSAVTCAPATFHQPSTLYNAYFTRNSGWTGADATYSVPLGDGKILWMFGDSFVGNCYPPDQNHQYRWRHPQGMIPNTFMIQDGSSFITVVGTGGLDPETWLYQPVAKTGNDYEEGVGREWYWPGDATVEDGVLYIFFTRFYRFGSGDWDYYPTQTDLFTFSVQDLQNLSNPVSQIAPTSITPYYITSNPGANKETMFGAALLEDNSNYYIYISDKISGFHFSKVLLVSQNDINGAKFYFDGYDASEAPTWTTSYSGPGVAQGVMKKKAPDGTLSDLAVSPQFSVFKIGSKYRLITQEDLNGRRIYSYESSSPLGPWECESEIYTIPEPDTMPVNTYNAFLHPEISGGSNKYLLSYNLNAQNWGDLYSRVDTYRPKFIWVNIP